MSVDAERPGPTERRGPIRAPQTFVGGLCLLALAALALWLTSGLSQGTLRAMGPAMLPRWLATAVGLAGLALVVLAFRTKGDDMGAWSLRGPVFVLLAILAFAFTIRPVTFDLLFFRSLRIGPFTSPGLGLVVAGPLSILIGGHATNEVRLRDLIILALSLTPFCMVLFGDLLNLPIPIFPQALAGLFPADWSQKQILRATAAIMAACAVAAFFIGRRSSPGPVDVADHSGRI